MSDQDILLFEYNKIKENPKEFIKDFSSYLKVKIDENLINNIRIKDKNYTKRKWIIRFTSAKRKFQKF